MRVRDFQIGQRISAPTFRGPREATVTGLATRWLVVVFDDRPGLKCKVSPRKATPLARTQSAERRAFLQSDAVRNEPATPKLVNAVLAARLGGEPKEKIEMWRCAAGGGYYAFTGSLPGQFGIPSLYQSNLEGTTVGDILDHVGL